MSSIIGNVAGGGVGGAILMVVIGLIKRRDGQKVGDGLAHLHSSDNTSAKRERGNAICRNTHFIPTAGESATMAGDLLWRNKLVSRGSAQHREVEVHCFRQIIGLNQ
jgi:hypothetical protein